MEHTTSIQHFLDLLAQLDAEHTWNLTLEVQQRYAQRIAELSSDIPRLTDAELCRMLCYYHTEHQLVEALVDSAHPDHATRWTEWTQQALRWLARKRAASQTRDATIISLEDLTQEAMCDLWRGLRTYRYRSGFQTWAFTVISNCLVRHYRALQTQKRGALLQAQSLDALVAAGNTFSDDAAPSLDEVALSDALAQLLWQVLGQHPDNRLLAIFQLWTCEEQTLRAIGEQLNLSVTRVHGLLTQAITLLRNEQAIRAWIASDSTPVPDSIGFHRAHESIGQPHSDRFANDQPSFSSYPR